MNMNSSSCIANITNYKVLGNVLLVSEVRGHLSVINELVEHTGAKAVIHTGCFGFYSPTSWQFLNVGELRYIADHLYFGSRQERADLAKSSPDALRDFFSNHPISQLPEYLDGRESFKVPVYTIWGNREDFEVLREFSTGARHVPNLYILFPNASYTIPCGELVLRVFGLGGYLTHDRLFNLGAGDGLISGDSGHCWVNFLQIGELLETAQRLPKPENEVRILLSHCSAGREAMVSLLAHEVQAAYCISGGQYSRSTAVFTPITTHTLDSFRTWLWTSLGPLEEMVQRVLECKEVSERERTLTLLAIDSLKRQYEGIKEDADMRKCICVALTMYIDGYALLNAFDDYCLGLDTHSRGHRFYLRPSQSKPITSYTTTSHHNTSNHSTSNHNTSNHNSTSHPMSNPIPMPNTATTYNSTPTLDVDSLPASPSSNSNTSRLSEMASSNYAGSAIIIISNLPYVRDEDEVRVTLLSEYRLLSVTFYNRFRDAVRCEAEDEATAVRILQELDGTSWQGNTIRVSRVGAGAKASTFLK